VLFRYQDLFEDELEIRPDQSGHDLLPAPRPCIDTRVQVAEKPGYRHRADLARM